MIVHDMKNLATRLSALMQNLEENYENPLFKKSMTDVLGDTIRKMNSIVKRFRDHQEHVVVKIRVDVNQILTDLLTALPPRHTKDIEIEFLVDETPLIWGDPYYLHDAFHNIIENALDAMPDEGTLTVETRLIQYRRKPKVLVEISDTGVGMTQAFLENKLFRPFVSTKEEGLGLGLFTSQQIIALHHGRIQVDSSPDTGTTFRITLPVEENV